MNRISNINLVKQYHKLAQLITDFNKRATELPDHEKLKKINASLMIKATINEMEERHIPVRDFGYKL